MFHKTVTLSIYAILIAVASCRPQGDAFDCSDRENGLYADPFDNNAFYVCLDGELVVRSKCDAEETFDADLKLCTGGSEDQDLTTYSAEGEGDDSVADMKSQVSDLLNESLRYVSETAPNNRPQRPTPPPSRPTPPPPPSRPPPPPPPFRPPPPPFKNKIINIQVTDNIFPRSVVVIGRANREQKNK